MTANYNDSMINELTTFFLTRHPWVSWTPTVTQDVAIGVTITYARYIILANTVIVRASLLLTSAGTAGNAIIIGGAPAVIAPANTGISDHIIGNGVVIDTGTGFYTPAVVAVGAADWRLITNTGNNFLGINPAYTIANTDRLGFYCSYERA